MSVLWRTLNRIFNFSHICYWFRDQFSLGCSSGSSCLKAIDVFLWDHSSRWNQCGLAFVGSASSRSVHLRKSSGSTFAATVLVVRNSCDQKFRCIAEQNVCSAGATKLFQQNCCRNFFRSLASTFLTMYASARCRLYIAQHQICYLKTASISV